MCRCIIFECKSKACVPGQRIECCLCDAGRRQTRECGGHAKTNVVGSRKNTKSSKQFFLVPCMRYVNMASRSDPNNELQSTLRGNPETQQTRTPKRQWFTRPVRIAAGRELASGRYFVYSIDAHNGQVERCISPDWVVRSMQPRMHTHVHSDDWCFSYHSRALPSMTLNECQGFGLHKMSVFCNEPILYLIDLAYPYQRRLLSNKPTPREPFYPRGGGGATPIRETLALYFRPQRSQQGSVHDAIVHSLSRSLARSRSLLSTEVMSHAPVRIGKW